MNRRSMGGAAVVTAGAVALLVTRRTRATGPGAGRAEAPRSRWWSVTIDCPPGQVVPGDRIPPALAALGDGIEVDVRPAPGDKGTELRARPRSERGEDPDPGRIRAALREAKQMIEVGEVLRVDPTPHGRRTPTPTGAFVELMTSRANKEGLL